MKKYIFLLIAWAIWPINIQLQAMQEASPMQMWQYYGKQVLKRQAIHQSAKPKTFGKISLKKKTFRDKYQMNQNSDDGRKRSRELFIGGILLLVLGFLGLMLASASENYILLLLVLLSGLVSVVLLITSLVVLIKAILKEPESKSVRSLPTWVLILGILAITPWIAGLIIKFSIALAIKSSFIPLIGLVLGLVAFVTGAIVGRDLQKRGKRKGRTINTIGIILGVIAMMLSLLI